MKAVGIVRQVGDSRVVRREQGGKALRNNPYLSIGPRGTFHGSRLKDATTMQEAVQTKVPTTPYQMIGGADVIRAIVNRFYDLVDLDPAYAQLRAMHAPDLGPMRRSLADFLIAWSGGPRHWFEQRPGACVMSAHAKFPIDEAVSDQWVDAMRRAVDEHLEPRFAGSMIEALGHMARAMIRPAHAA
jgi:hemoglobin